MWFFITYYYHSYYLRLLKLKSSGKRVASAVFLTVPAALQASFRVKQCYLGLPPPISSCSCYCNGCVCPRCSLQERRAHNTAHTCRVELFSLGNPLYSPYFHYSTYVPQVSKLALFRSEKDTFPILASV